jgi:hypothetical protein
MTHFKTKQGRLWLTGLLLLTVVPLSSCFVRKRVVAVPGNPVSAPLRTATKEELIERIHQVADRLESFSMQMALSPSTGSVYAGEIKDYATLGGYILYRKPDDIRILTTDPMLGTTVVDMASVGESFRVNIPSQNRFIEGKNDAPPTSQRQVENLRPAAVLSALLFRPPDPRTETALLEEDTNESGSVYILLIVRRDADQLMLLRAMHFERVNLEIVRQKSFDPSGHIVSDAKYSGWRSYDGIPFPSAIDIKRPQDRYEVRVDVHAMKMNPADLTPEKFILDQPEGARLENLP